MDAGYQQAKPTEPLASVPPGRSTKCPSCGFENILGEDRCAQCLHSLMQVDLPKPKKDDTLQRVLLMDPVGNLVTGKDLLVANTSDTMHKIVKILQKEQKDAVLIYKSKKLVGIISFRDIVQKCAGIHKELAQVKADQIMTRYPETVTAEDPIAFAVNKMAMGGFRHLPVLQADGAPLSIISIKDVLNYLSRRDSGK